MCYKTSFDNCVVLRDDGIRMIYCEEHLNSYKKDYEKSYKHAIEALELAKNQQLQYRYGMIYELLYPIEKQRGNHASAAAVEQ